jgi:hypothetical protein
MRYYNPLSDTVSESESDSSWAIPLFELREIHENASFAPGTQMQVVWDSVSLSALKKCPRYYKWSIVDGYQLSPMPSTLLFGIDFHLCLNTWHRLLAEGIDKETALIRCVRLAGLLGEYLIPNRPERTKETLIRSIVWYLDQFTHDPATTTLRPNGQPSSELSFVIPLFELNDHKMYLAGHIDRVVEFLGDIYLLDYKTTKGQLNDSFFSGFKPHVQVQGYLIAAHVLAGSTSSIPREPRGMIIDGIQLGVTFTRFQRSIVQYTPLEVESCLADLEYWFKLAAMFTESDHYPANETACSNYGGCVFQSICSTTPPKRQKMLDSGFARQTWDCSQSR